LLHVGSQQIRHGHDAFQHSTLADNGQTANATLQQELASVAYGRIFSDGNHLFSHDLPYRHPGEQVFPFIRHEVGLVRSMRLTDITIRENADEPAVLRHHGQVPNASHFHTVSGDSKRLI
jgi:hypothetical protein